MLGSLRAHQAKIEIDEEKCAQQSLAHNKNFIRPMMMIWFVKFSRVKCCFGKYCVIRLMFLQPVEERQMLIRQPQ